MAFTLYLSSLLSNSHSSSRMKVKPLQPAETWQCLMKEIRSYEVLEKREEGMRKGGEGGTEGEDRMRSGEVGEDQERRGSAGDEKIKG